MRQTKSMNRRTAVWLLIVLLSGIGSPVSRAETKVIAGRAAGSPGFSALVPFTLESDAEIAGLQFDLAFNPDHLVGWEIFPGADLGDQEIHARQLEPGKIRDLVYSPASTWLPNGNIVSCEFQLAGDAPLMVQFLSLVNPTVASSSGNRVTDAFYDGVLARSPVVQAGAANRSGHAGLSRPRRRERRHRTLHWKRLRADDGDVRFSLAGMELTRQ